MPIAETDHHLHVRPKLSFCDSADMGGALQISGASCVSSLFEVLL